MEIERTVRPGKSLIKSQQPTSGALPMTERLLMVHRLLSECVAEFPTGMKRDLLLLIASEAKKHSTD